MSSDSVLQFDEETLVARAQRDRSGFAPLYERYLPVIYGYCRLRLESDEAAEDATTTIFVKALGALPRYQIRKPGGFRAWLYTIAHHVITDHHRERLRHPRERIEMAALPDDTADPSEQAITSMNRLALRNALTALPEEQRRIIEMRLAGLNDRETATALGRSHGAVRMSQLRAIQRSRRLLNPSANGGEPCL